MSIKQDGTAPRTAADLERKYGFGRTFAEMYGLIADARSVAEEAQNAFEGLNHEEIFNRLTNYGEWQGIYRDSEDNVYINASYIKSGEFDASLIKTGTLDASLIEAESIAGWQIKTNSIEADALHINGLLSVYTTIITDGDLVYDEELEDFVQEKIEEEVVGGHIGYDSGFYGNTSGIGMISGNGYSQMVCTDHASRMSYTDDESHITQVVCGQELALSSVGLISFSISGDIESYVAGIDGDAIYPMAALMTLGKPKAMWADVYAANTSMSELLARVQALEGA